MRFIKLLVFVFQLLAFVSIESKAQILINPYQVQESDAIPAAPLYATLGTVEAIWDATGLATNTNNTYGQVDASNNIGAAGWKSLAPGPTGRDLLPINFAGTGNLSIQMIGAVPVINSNGYGTLRNTGGSANFNFLHYNATFANLKWTQHILVRPGFGVDPGEVYGFMGTDGRSASRKGVSVWGDDREGISLSDRLVHGISKGSAGYISTSSDDDKVTPNVWQLLTMEFDGSLAAADRMKAWIDGVSVPITVTSSSTVVVTTSTYDLELFATGNGLAPLTGQMSHCIIQSRVETSGVRDAFIDSLVPWKNYFNAHLQSSINERLRVYNTLHDDLTKYYFCVAMDQNPTAPNTILQIYTQGTDHLTDASKKLCTRVSTDYGTTWSVQSDISDPVGNLCIQSTNGVYTSTGRFSALYAEVTTGAVNWLPEYLKYAYSDNDGATWDLVDLTSLWPADGSGAIQAIGQAVVNDGYIMHPFFTYPAADPADITSSGNYILRIAEGADPSVLGNWSVITVRAYSAGSFISELSLIALSDTDIYGIARNEGTKEFSVLTSVDNGATTFTDVGDLSLSENFSVGPSQASLCKYGNNVVLYYPDRGGPRILKVVYSTISDLLANPITGWNLATKATIVPDLLQGGAFIHPYNTKFAIGLSAKEPNPTTLVNNKLILYYVPTIQAP